MHTQMTLKSRLQQGETVIGTFCFLPNEDAVEAIARAGLDFVVIDMEHGPKDWSTLANMIRAAELGGASSLVRVPRNDENEILRALELGAEGVLVPFIRDASDAKRALAAARYAPVGTRGVCTLTRASGYGLRREEFSKLAMEANESILVLGIIEDLTGVENAKEILDMNPGLDAILGGRADLAAALGVPGQTNDEKVLKLLQELSSTTEAHPSPAVFGIVIYAPEEAAGWAASGAKILIYSADTAVLSRAYSEKAVAFRKALTEVSTRTRS